MGTRKINLGTHNSCTSYPVKGFWGKKMKKKQNLHSEGGPFEYFVVDFIEDIA